MKMKLVKKNDKDNTYNRNVLCNNATFLRLRKEEKKKYKSKNKDTIRNRETFSKIKIGMGNVRVKEMRKISESKEKKMNDN